MDFRLHRRGFLGGSLAALMATRLDARAAGNSIRQASPRLQAQSPDWDAVAQTLGAFGQMMDSDVFRVAMPRSDLQITAKGVTLKPAFALGSYAAFKQFGDQRW